VPAGQQVKQPAHQQVKQQARQQVLAGQQAK